VSGSLQISIQANSGSLLRTKMVPSTVEPSQPDNASRVAMENIVYTLDEKWTSNVEKHQALRTLF
jgi:hypothetical protein